MNSHGLAVRIIETVNAWLCDMDEYYIDPDEVTVKVERMIDEWTAEAEEKEE